MSFYKRYPFKNLFIFTAAGVKCRVIVLIRLSVPYHSLDRGSTTHSVIIILNSSNDMTKPTKWVCIQRRLRSALSGSSLCVQWTAKDPRFLHADSEDFDQTGRMPWLIWVFAVRTLVLLVLSCSGSFVSRFPCFQWIYESDSTCEIQEDIIIYSDAKYPWPSWWQDG